MHKVLFTGNTLSKEDIDRLKSKGLLIEPGPIDFTEDQLIEALQGAEGYIMGGEERATRKVIGSAPDLRIIAFYGAGYERYVDVEAATSRGIAVTYTPKANAYTVAEFTVGLVLDAVKRLTYLNNKTKTGAFERRQAWNLQGRVLGIIGMGAIGTHVARILHNGFEMKVIYVSRTPKLDVEAELGARKVNLPELLRQSNVVSVHISYSEETVGMLGDEEFKMMKPEAVLVNTARAEIVDASALYRALESGAISIAAFDGYYKEPVPSPEQDEYKLLSLPDDRFIITPHTSYNSLDAIKAMDRLAVNSILDVFEGREPEHLINSDYKKHSS
jgi:glyoxylate reductase